MKQLITIFSGWLLLLTVSSVFAENPTFNCQISGKNNCIQHFKKNPIALHNISHQRLITATFYSGSLRDNIVRTAHENGWSTVVWNAPEDYKWIGETRIAAATIQDIFRKLLTNYPLQAQFYNGNHVLAIVPRNLP